MLFDLMLCSLLLTGYICLNEYKVKLHSRPNISALRGSVLIRADLVAMQVYIGYLFVILLIFTVCLLVSFISLINVLR